MPLPRPAPKTRVTVVGLLPDQRRKVEAKLHGRATFHFVDKNRKPDSSAIPDNQDVIVLMANFINHSMQELAKRKIAGTPTRLVIHHGGIETLVTKLEPLLPSVPVAV